MAVRKLFEMPALDDEPFDVWNFHLREDVEERWNVALQLDSSDEDRTVSVQGVIGYPEWADGTRARDVEKRLKHLGKGDVTVRINSPGGDFFEGQAMHNLLRMHDGRVFVDVIGMAASAASIVAMAGDEIRIPKSAWFMVHGVWGITIGNQYDLAAAIKIMARMDEVSADIYAERTGQPRRDIVELMKGDRGEGTFLSGVDAVERGFADKLMDDGKVKADEKKQAVFANAKALISQACQKSGLSRKQIRAAFAQLRPGTLRAADDGTSRAADLAPLNAGIAEFRAELEKVNSMLKGIKL